MRGKKSVVFQDVQVDVFTDVVFSEKQWQRNTKIQADIDLVSLLSSSDNSRPK